jgi:hypothetical protein
LGTEIWARYQKRNYFNFPWWYDVYTVLFLQYLHNHCSLEMQLRTFGGLKQLCFYRVIRLWRIFFNRCWFPDNPLLMDHLVDIELRKWMSKSILPALLMYSWNKYIIFMCWTHRNYIYSKAIQLHIFSVCNYLILSTFSNLSVYKKKLLWSFKIP